MIRMEEWQTIEGMHVHAWSISGLETCVVLKKTDLGFVAFDMGASTRESLKCQHVFISHGHMDHISAIPQHATKQDLFKMKPATYFVPSHLVEPLQDVAEGYYRMHESSESLGKLRIKGIEPGDTVHLPGGHFIQPFPTVHRVRSQGYILYRKLKKLNPEYLGLPGHAVAAKIREGVAVHNTLVTPEVAYTGDTQFEIFLSPPNPDLLKVRLLIMETTYIDDSCSVEKAKDRGHIHLHELVRNAHLFSNVQSILLIHLSDKYSPRFIRDTVYKSLPHSLVNKVHLGLLAKEKY
ncbi:uncharacterized protein LOC135477220 [Liolophura sinensis]|uniref:uncharacterized protein LOC135477220 n=1 Tax=Liolophura sinensis TaxID=3198878 RepID=UPI003158EAAD